MQRMYVFRNARPTDADRCFDIETSAYTRGEAATRQKIVNRIETYPEGFLVLEVDGEIVGFINCGCAHNVDMSDAAFKDLVGHDPDALNVVIMSVVIDPAHQGHGLSRVLMIEFVDRMRKMGKATVHLMCKTQYLKLYEKFGYRYVKLSTSNHGGVRWHEMSMAL